jgi:DNA-binding NarL/FixJ family response regulator
VSEMRTSRVATYAVQHRHLQVVHGAAPYAVAPAPATTAPFWAARLSRREIEVLHCIAVGLSTSEIAQALFISTATVKSHIARLIAKVEVRDRLQLVVAAYRSGFIRLD